VKVKITRKHNDSVTQNTSVTESADKIGLPLNFSFKEYLNLYVIMLMAETKRVLKSKLLDVTYVRYEVKH
jgi:hypothetical protein